jgi:hypothetical protein
MTGWGQFGPYAQAAGHDINYIALAGALHAYGRAGEKPTPPINMVGDFGGGGMMLAFGMVSALLHAKTTGQGQVIDAAMTDGAATLMSMIWGFKANGIWSDDRGTNLLDTGAHMYDTYETSDAKWISIGSLEPQFYAELRRLAGLTDDKDFDAQMDRSQWGPLKAKLTELTAMRAEAEAKETRLIELRKRLEMSGQEAKANKEQAAQMQKKVESQVLEIEGVKLQIPPINKEIEELEKELALRKKKPDDKPLPVIVRPSGSGFSGGRKLFFVEASNATITPLACAAAKISLPYLATRCLLAVTTCLPLAMARSTSSLAGE